MYQTILFMAAQEWLGGRNGQNAFTYGVTEAERRCIFFWLASIHEMFLSLGIYS